MAYYWQKRRPTSEWDDWTQEDHRRFLEDQEARAKREEYLQQLIAADEAVIVPKGPPMGDLSYHNQFHRKNGNRWIRPKPQCP